MNASPLLQLYVRDVLNPNRSVVVTLAKESTVTELKKAISKQHTKHPSPGCQRVLFQGRVLSNTEKLSAIHGGHDGAITLHLWVQSPRSAAPDKDKASSGSTLPASLQPLFARSHSTPFASRAAMPSSPVSSSPFLARSPSLAATSPWHQYSPYSRPQHGPSQAPPPMLLRSTSDNIGATHMPMYGPGMHYRMPAGSAAGIAASVVATATSSEAKASTSSVSSSAAASTTDSGAQGAAQPAGDGVANANANAPNVGAPRRREFEIEENEFDILERPAPPPRRGLLRYLDLMLIAKIVLLVAIFGQDVKRSRLVFLSVFGVVIYLAQVGLLADAWNFLFGARQANGGNNNNNNNNNGRENNGNVANGNNNDNGQANREAAPPAAQNAAGVPRGVSIVPSTKLGLAVFHVERFIVGLFASLVPGWQPLPLYIPPPPVVPAPADGPDVAVVQPAAGQ